MLSTFEDCYTTVLARCGLSVTAPVYVTEAQTAVNQAYLTILSYRKWPFLRDTAHFETTAFITGGIVTGTAGSVDITGTGVNWTGASSGWQLIGTSDMTIYNVESINPATGAMTVDRPLTSDLNTSGYWLFPLTYPVPANCDTPISENLFIPQRQKLRYIEEWDMRRRLMNPVFSEPRLWSVFFGGTGNPSVVFHPIPDKVYAWDFPYSMVTPSLVNPTDTLVIPEPYRAAVVELALGYVYSDVLNMLDMAEAAQARGKNLLQQMGRRYATVTDDPYFQPYKFRRRLRNTDPAIVRMTWEDT